jgi:hypothetical protein
MTARSSDSVSSASTTSSAKNSPSELRRIDFSCVAMAALAQSAVFHRIIRSNLAQRENMGKKTQAASKVNCNTCLV